MRERSTDIPLDGIVLTDVRTGDPVEPGHLPGVAVLTLIRHRF